MTKNIKLYIIADTNFAMTTTNYKTFNDKQEAQTYLHTLIPHVQTQYDSVEIDDQTHPDNPKQHPYKEWHFIFDDQVQRIIQITSQIVPVPEGMNL